MAYMRDENTGEWLQRGEDPDGTDSDDVEWNTVPGASVPDWVWDMAGGDDGMEVWTETMD